MRAVLFGPTAIAWWLAAARARDTFKETAIALDGVDAPRVAIWEYVSKLYPFLAQPLHLIAKKASLDERGRWRGHVSRYELPDGSFLQIGPGVYVPTPELAFVQACPLLPVHESLKIGGALCGSFRIAPSSISGLESRAPLTTPRKIKREAMLLRTMRGTRQALSVVDWLPVGAASPAEVFLALALHCPSRLGGYGLPLSRLNARIVPSKTARRIARRDTLVPDMLWKKERLVVEFDSDTIHLTGQQLSKDASKRMALNGDGYHVITVTTRQLKSPLAMDDVAHEIARHLRIPFRQRSRNFRQRQMELFRVGWSLGGLFSSEGEAGECPVAEMRR